MGLFSSAEFFLNSVGSEGHIVGLVKLLILFYAIGKKKFVTLGQKNAAYPI